MDNQIFKLGFSLNTGELKKGTTELKSFAKAGDQAETSSGKLKSSVNLLSGAFAALSASYSVQQINRYSDGWLSLNNQLKVVIESEEQLIETRQKLVALSKETRSNLSATVGLYAELYRNTESLGLSETQLLSITRTLNNLFVAGGKSAQEQANALTQLQQGLASGALRGDEFNSVAENAPRILDALSNYLGIAKGELRDFAATGGITTEILTGALESYNDTAQDLADRTDKTFEQFAENATTNLMVWVGASDAVKAASNAMGQALEDVSENLDAVQDAVIAGAAVYATYATMVGVKSVAALVAQIAQSSAAAKAKLTEAAATQAAAVAEKERLVVQQASLAAQLSSAQSTRTQAAVRAQLAANTTALTAAEVRLTAATTAVSTAQKAAAVSTGILATAMRGLRTAVGFLTGPWGLALTAVGLGVSTFLATKDSSDDLNKSLTTQKDKVDKLTGSWQELNAEGKKNTITKLKAQIASWNVSLVAAQNNLDSLQKKQASLSTANRGLETNLAPDIQDQKDQIQSLRNLISAAGEEMSKIFDSTMPKDWVDPTKPSGGTDTDEVNKQIASLQQLRKEIGKNADELFVLRQEQQSIANGDSPALTAQIKAQAQEYVKARAEYQSTMEAQRQATEEAEAAFESLVTSQNKVPESYTIYQDWIDDVKGYKTQLQETQDEINKVNQAVANGELSQDEASPYLTSLQDQLDGLQQDGKDFWVEMAQGAADWASVLSLAAEEGSSMESDLQNVATAAQGVVSFMSGDYLSAATSAITLLDSLGDVGDAYEADEIQAEQFLDEWGDKLDSISTSTETAADASEDLVSINTDMLDALETLSQAISDAASLISGDVDTDLIDNDALFDDNPLSGISYTLRSMFSAADWLGLDDSIFDGLFSSILGSGLDLIGGLLGGSSSTVDSGIQVVGGYITDLIDDITVNAYETVKYKKYAWSSSSKKTGYENVGSEIENQFSLVFGSLYDSVYEAASAINMDDADIIEALESFYVDTTKISLDGLDSDEAEEEIEAYFSDVFNDIASAVVPYLEDFQDAGEELGDTLTRLATEVSVLEVLFDLGTAFGNLYDSSYDLVSAADNIATLLGGSDEFSEYVSSFLTDFASDAVMMEMYGDTLTDSLSEVGLSLPSTADDFYDLVTSLDASTEAGQEQIATLLESESLAAAYYDYLEDISDSFDELKDSIWDDDDEDAFTSVSQALADAMAGDFSTTEDLLENGISMDEEDYSNAYEYAAAQAVTSNMLDDLESLYTGETTVDEEQLSVLQEIRDSLVDDTISTDTSDDDDDTLTELATMTYDNYKQLVNLNTTLDRISKNGLTVTS